MAFEEKTIDSEYIYRGKILNLRRDKVTVERGSSYREIIEYNGAAAIVPVTEEGKVIMVKQFRKPMEKFIMEIPAGKLEKGEAPLEAAKRELREETGYSAENFTLLTEYYPSVGYSEEIIYIYMCSGLTPGETDFDENESIDMYEIPLEELVEDIMAGRIGDGKTIAGIMMAARRLGR